jgi:hypothetical protein
MHYTDVIPKKRDDILYQSRQSVCQVMGQLNKISQFYVNQYLELITCSINKKQKKRVFTKPIFYFYNCPKFNKAY